MSTTTISTSTASEASSARTSGPLHGMAALVTGGIRGIGATAVTHLAELGADVAFTYLQRGEDAQAVAERASADGAAVHALQADAGDHTAMIDAVNQAHDRLGRLDVLINNAGVTPQGSLSDTSDADFERAFKVNVQGPFVAARAAAEHMQPGGRSINIGSVWGERVPFPGLSLYAMTKFALAPSSRFSPARSTPR